MDDRICEAIRKGAVLSFDYRGRHCTAEPHVHGKDRDGKEVLRGWQTVAAGETAGWRLYEVEQMSRLRATGGTFDAARREFDPYDATLAEVHCFFGQEEPAERNGA